MKATIAEILARRDSKLDRRSTAHLDSLAPQPQSQFSVNYLLAEIALIATTFAAARCFFITMPRLEAQAICFCVAMTSGFGALGGAYLRMTVGLVVGSVFSVASIPLLWILMTTPAN